MVAAFIIVGRGFISRRVEIWTFLFLAAASHRPTVLVKDSIYRLSPWESSCRRQVRGGILALSVTLRVPPLPKGEALFMPDDTENLFYQSCRPFLVCFSSLKSSVESGTTSAQAAKLPAACRMSNTSPDAIHAIVMERFILKNSACAGA